MNGGHHEPGTESSNCSHSTHSSTGGDGEEEDNIVGKDFWGSKMIVIILIG